VGICAIFLSGLFKFACALGSGWVRRWVPRAGLLGSLTGVALVLISFLPLLQILDQPLVGLVSLAIILTALIARVRLPFRVPGALGALLVGGLVFYLLQWTGYLDAPQRGAFQPHAAMWPYEWVRVFRCEWLAALPDAVHYLPMVIPFALATVIGGIDCTESAAAAGDEFHTGSVIAVEAFATLVASLCGGVIQTTPYIGHPAYKAMGGRAAYTLATALFIGSAGLLGYFGYLYAFVPQATVYPILMFVGLEITAQSFLATPQRHYAALALACVPALAALAWIFASNLLGDKAILACGLGIDSLQNPALRQELHTLQILSSGFIVTSLLWASGLALIIDRRLRLASLYFWLAAACTLFGIIHSPLPGGALFWPWELGHSTQRVVFDYAGGYAAVAAILLAWGAWHRHAESPR
jgi:AGZA family xanthine/uracil permease-like MFS transporter